MAPKTDPAKPSPKRRGVRWLVGLGVAALLAWAVVARLLADADAGGGRGGRSAAAVEVAAVERADLEETRTFSGTLVSPRTTAVATKVGGRAVEVAVDFADTVRRGDLLARLDDDEARSQLAAARAEEAVAAAAAGEAASNARLARSRRDRIRGLVEQEVSADVDLEAAEAEAEVAQSRVAVAAAERDRARAAAEAAAVRLGYTRVRAEWSGDDDARVVGERFLDEGDTVAANAPVVSLFDPDPLRAELDVTERDYALVEPGRPASLETDAHPGVRFPAEVDRVSRVFDPASRQARVALRVPNADGRLRPGLFVRARMVVGRAEGALAVPGAALARRGGAEVLFVVEEGEEGLTTRRVPVAVGVRAGDRVEVRPLDGASLDPGDRVVTLGQQLVDDGSPVTVPGDEEQEEEATAEPAP